MKIFNSNRISRKDYWISTLLILLLSVLISISMDNQNELIIIVFSFINFLLVIFQIIIRIKRLHDINRSGWLMLYSLLPIIGGIYLIYLFCKKGDVNMNKYN